MSLQRRACTAPTSKKALCGNRRTKYDPATHRYLCYLHHPDPAFREVQTLREEARLQRRKDRITAERLSAYQEGK